MFDLLFAQHMRVGMHYTGILCSGLAKLTLPLGLFLDLPPFLDL